MQLKYKLIYEQFIKKEKRDGKKKAIHDFYEMKNNSEKVTWLTSYDFPTAQFAEAAGLDMILVGNSLGMCVYGYKGTVPVTMDQCIVHCDAVRRGAPNTFVVGDMPFMSYQISDENAVYNAGQFLKKADVDAIKLEGGTTSLVGFNLSNSVNNQTIFEANLIRKQLGLEKQVRFEHHITETYQAIVNQPYNRRDELLEIVKKVPNISAKHEGGEVEIEKTREHPSNILEYFLTKSEIMESNLMGHLETNYLDKHHSVNLTAQALIKSGVGVTAAKKLH